MPASMQAPGGRNHPWNCTCLQSPMPASMQAPGGWTHPWYCTCRAASVGLPSSADAQSPSGASRLGGMTLQAHVDRHFPDLDLEQDDGQAVLWWHCCGYQPHPEQSPCELL